MGDPDPREALTAALQRFVEAYGGFREGEYLGDWAFIAHLPRVEETGRAEYFTGFHVDHVPNHVARGLFGEALAHLDALQEVRGGDDE